MIGEITWKELSPELQDRINQGSGSGGGSSFSIIKNIITEKVVVEVQDQVEFTIPFENYETVNCHLDIKINSTWVNPERYTINGLTVTLDEGQDLGTKIFFTMYELGECTPDGGYIQDVDVAETPQDVIIYDGSIIDEKITAHNQDIASHPELVEGIDSLSKETFKQYPKLTSGTIVDYIKSLHEQGITKGAFCTKGSTDSPAPSSDVSILFYRLASRTVVDATVEYNGLKYNASINNDFTGYDVDWKQLANQDELDSLSGQVNGWKTYNSLNELGLTTADTTQKIFETMMDYTMLITYELPVDIPKLYTGSYHRGIMELHKISHGRSEGRFITIDGNTATEWTCTYSTSTNPVFSGWKRNINEASYTPTQDFDQLKGSGFFYLGTNATNTPLGNRDQWYSSGVGLPDGRNAVHWAVRRLNNSNAEIYFRQLYNEVWHGWTRIATTAKTEIAFPYASGYTDDASNESSSSLIKVNNTVEMVVNMKKEDGTPFTPASNVPLITLPVGCRPTKIIRLISASSNPYDSYGTVVIVPSGNVYLRGVSNANMKSIMFTVRFEVA